MSEKIKEVNLVLIITIIISLISGDIYYFIVILLGASAPFVETLWFRLVFGQLLLILPLLCYLYIKKVEWKNTLRIQKLKKKNVLKLVVLAYLLLPVMAFINGISLFFSENQVAETLSNMSAQGSLFGNIVIIALIPCIVEETVFRGLLYNSYKEAGFKKALLFSSFIFGLMHYNLNQFSYAFIMGIIFILLLEGTGSILAPIIVHFTINCNSIVMQHIIPYLLDRVESVGEEVIQNSVEMATSTNALINSIIYYGMLSIVTGILAYKMFQSIVKTENRTEQLDMLLKGKTETKSKIITFPLMCMIALGVVYLIVRSFYLE